MSPQEIRTEAKTLPSTKKPLHRFKLPAAFSISWAAFFTCGLVASYKFIENSVSSELMDYLTSSLVKNQKKAAIITNLQDGLSCISLAIVSLISQAYTGPFTMIAFCSSLSIMGLMLFWVSFMGRSLRVQYDLIYMAILLITLGSSGGTMSEEFLDYQLNEKVKRDKEKIKAEHKEGTNNAKKEDLKMEDEQSQPFFFWKLCAQLSGYAIAISGIFPAIVIQDKPNIGVGSIFMVGTYLLFYFGYAWYSHEKLPAESNIGKIYRICKAAIRKRSLRKAAIIKERSDLSPQKQEEEKELCTVMEAKEMKRLALLICWGFTFFAYNLFSASGNTFFVTQAANLRGITGPSSDNDLYFLFIIKSSISEILAFFFWIFGVIFERMEISKMVKTWFIKFGFIRTDAIVFKISVGMVSALLCCLSAWHVEKQILHQYQDGKNPMSTVALIPQFVMLGLAEYLVTDGLKELFNCYTSKTMRSFDESFSQLKIGTGKLFTIPAILIFKGWVQASPKTSRLDTYYLMLAILNGVFLLLFVIYYFRYAYKIEYSEDEEIIVKEQQQTLDNNAHQAGSEGIASEVISPVREGPLISEKGEEVLVEQSLEHAHQPQSEEVNSTEIVLAIVSDGKSDESGF